MAFLEDTIYCLEGNWLYSILARVLETDDELDGMT